MLYSNMGYSKNKRWKLGDFCYYEFKLVEVLEILGNRVRQVGDGYSIISSRADEDSDLSPRMFLLTRRNIMISNHYKLADDIISKLSKIFSMLNYPGIHKWIVKEWCLASRTTKDSDLLAYYDRLTAFCEEIKEASIDMKDIRIEGISIFIKEEGKETKNG